VLLVILSHIKPLPNTMTLAKIQRAARHPLSHQTSTVPTFPGHI